MISWFINNKLKQIYCRCSRTQKIQKGFLLVFLRATLLLNRNKRIATIFCFFKFPLPSTSITAPPDLLRRPWYRVCATLVIAVPLRSCCDTAVLVKARFAFVCAAADAILPPRRMFCELFSQSRNVWVVILKLFGIRCIVVVFRQDSCGINSGWGFSCSCYRNSLADRLHNPFPIFISDRSVQHPTPIPIGIHFKWRFFGRLLPLVGESHWKRPCALGDLRSKIFTQARSHGVAFGDSALKFCCAHKYLFWGCN